MPNSFSIERMASYSCALINYCACYTPQTKVSHLDVVGRPVVVLEKTNVVPEHSQYFQVLLLCVLSSQNCYNDGM